MAIVSKPQAGVEPLFENAPRPDPLQAARQARAEAARLRRAVATARESYLSAASDLEVATITGKPRAEIDRLRQRMWDLHGPVRDAMAAVTSAGYPLRTRGRGGPRP